MCALLIMEKLMGKRDLKDQEQLLIRDIQSVIKGKKVKEICIDRDIHHVGNKLDLKI